MKNLGGSAIKHFDPLLRDIDLPLTAAYYPLGVRLNIATNSPEVLEAAAECWGGCRQELAYAPLEFRVIVQPEGGLATPPAFRSQGHLYAIVSDAHNFALADLQSLFAAVFVSGQTAADHARLRWFFVEAIAHALLSQRYVVPLHAACVARNGSGILLCGASGAGKSTLSFACARAGWTFVSDDCTFLLADADDRMAIGNPHQARFRDDAANLFSELAGHTAQSHPNGKLSIEVPMAAFPEIRTAARCPINGVVLLDRRSGSAPCAEALSPALVAGRLLEDGPSYGEEVTARHETAVRRLLGVPTYRLQYDAMDDAVGLLSNLIPTTRK